MGFRLAIHGELGFSVERKANADKVGLMLNENEVYSAVRIFKCVFYDKVSPNQNEILIQINVKITYTLF